MTSDGSNVFCYKLARDPFTDRAQNFGKHIWCMRPNSFGFFQRSKNIWGKKNKLASWHTFSWVAYSGDSTVKFCEEDLMSLLESKQNKDSS